MFKSLGNRQLLLDTIFKTMDTSVEITRYTDACEQGYGSCFGKSNRRRTYVAEVVRNTFLLA